MKDVAREAGVSLGTVSNVFNNIPVGQEYQQKVQEAADRLGYTVNSYARGLRTDRTNTVAVVLPGMQNMFFAALADSLCQELRLRNCRMYLSTTQYDPDAEARCVRMLKQNMVDGIIGLTYTTNRLDLKGIPYVSIDRVISPDIPCVTSDNYSGGTLAADRLISLGCKNLLFLRIGSPIVGETDKRGIGFSVQSALRGVPCESARFNDEDGMETIFRFLDAHISEGKLSFDGIFCSTDHLLCLVRTHLHSRGIRVPEDVQMIGYDGTRVFFDQGYVCSSIVQPVPRIAEAAVDILLNQEAAHASALICLPVFYAAGGTTREPPEDS